MAPRETAFDNDEYKPLTAEQVQALRQKQPLLSVWRVVLVQLAVAALTAVLAWWLTGQTRVGQSAAYGGLSVVIPAALFARGMTSRLTRVNLGTAVTGFLFWEMVKIGLTVAMLVLANVWFKDVSWPAMLVGFVVTLKVYWVVLGFGRMFYPKIKT